MLMVQARENRRAFVPDGVEGIRVKAKDLQDSGSHLSGLDKAVDGPGLDARIRYQQHHVRIIPSEAAMLGLLFQTSGVDHAHVRQHDDIGGARVTTFPFEAAGTGFVRHPRRVKDACERTAVEDLTQSHCCSGVLQSRYCVPVRFESASHSWEMSSSASPRPLLGSL